MQTENSVYIQNNEPNKLPWVLFLFLFFVFFFATPYNIFKSLNYNLNEQEILQQTELGVTSQNNLMRSISLFFLLNFSIYSLLYKRRYRLRINGLLGWLILSFLFVSIFSIAWADDKQLTLKRLFVLFVFSIASLALADRLTLKEIIHLVFFVCGISLGIGVLNEIVLGTFRPFSNEYFYGGMMQPNIAAWNLVMLTISALVLSQMKASTQLFYYFLAIVAFIFLILTRSRTPFYSLIITLIVYGFFVLRKSTFAFIALGLIIVVIVLFLIFGDQINYYIGRIFFLGRESDYANTLTGRIPHWKMCLSYVFDRPLLGYGYNSFWTSEHIYNFYKKSTLFLPNAHNSYLEIALSLGMIPSIIYMNIFIIGIWKSIKLYVCTKKIEYGFIVCIFLWLSLNMLMESLNIGVFFHKLIFMILFAKLAFFEITHLEYHKQKHRHKENLL